MTRDPVCFRCKHFDRDSMKEDGWGACKAFPEAIPVGIWGQGNPHEEPFPGDGGIRFEPEE